MIPARTHPAMPYRSDQFVLLLLLAMTGSHVRLDNPPIVEAVLDLECDLPPGTDFLALEQSAHEQFKSEYPKSQRRYVQEHTIQAKPNEPPTTTTGRLAPTAYLFKSQDEKQIVQVRAEGFSFNRLAPYSNLDEYFPEIERTWRLYLQFVSPVTIRLVRLRYINRILLPLPGDVVDLDDFFKTPPRFEMERLKRTSFFSQQIAVEDETGHEALVRLATQAAENQRLPVILDITAAGAGPIDPGNWPQIRGQIDSLRALKNHIFFNSLT